MVTLREFRSMLRILSLIDRDDYPGDTAMIEIAFWRLTAWILWPLFLLHLRLQPPYWQARARWLKALGRR